MKQLGTNSLNTIKEGDKGTWGFQDCVCVTNSLNDGYGFIMFHNIKKDGTEGKKYMTWVSTPTRGWHSQDNTNSGWRKIR